MYPGKKIHAGIAGAQQGNSATGKGFAQIKKLQALRQYRKLQNKGTSVSTQCRNSQGATSNKHRTGKKVSAGQSIHFKAEKEFQKKKRQQKEEKKRVKIEALAREQALAQYESNKKKKHKLLAKRTMKGQPHMGNQMDYLLQKIQKQKSSG